MPLTTKDFNTLVSDQVASMQAKLPNLQFPIGSPNLSLVEANAGVGLWMQAIVLQQLALCRAGSCTGSDLDSFFLIFKFFRNGAQDSSGQVTFFRNTTTNQATVKVGSLVQASASLVQFQVYADTSNPNFNISLNAYVLAPSVASISVPVVALVAGLNGNVNAGAINQIASSIVGVDSVNNAQPFTNGYARESDDSYRQRFPDFINSLTSGNLLAYKTAIRNGTPSVFYKIAENVDINGNLQLGFVTIIIDDGSGSPPTSLIDNIFAKVDAVRALSVQIGVYPVVILTANLAVSVELNPLFDAPTIVQAIKDKVGDYVSSLQIGQKLIATKIYQLIYEASAGIIEASGLLINGSPSDLTPTFKERVFIGTFSVSVI